MINSPYTIYAVLGGILPALIWLFFWLHEDSKRPEPRGLILATFVLGMLSVVLVLPFQKAVDVIFPGTGVIAFFLWAILEEGFKLGAAFTGGLRTKENNEPIDAMIYMITAALGFTALENSLFILNPLLQADLAGGVMTSGLRFIGASLLHTVSSGIIGTALALSFYKKMGRRVLDVSIAFAIAVVFHTIFNLFVIHESQMSTPIAFAGVWVAVAILLLFFERIKALRT